MVHQAIWCGKPHIVGLKVGLLAAHAQDASAGLLYPARLSISAAAHMLPCELIPILKLRQLPGCHVLQLLKGRIPSHWLLLIWILRATVQGPLPSLGRVRNGSPAGVTCLRLDGRAGLGQLLYSTSMVIGRASCAKRRLSVGNAAVVAIYAKPVQERISSSSHLGACHPSLRACHRHNYRCGPDGPGELILLQVRIT